MWLASPLVDIQSSCFLWLFHFCDILFTHEQRERPFHKYKNNFSFPRGEKKDIPENLTRLQYYSLPEVGERENYV